MHRVTARATVASPNLASRTAFALLLGVLLSACTATGGPTTPDPDGPGVAEPYIAKGRVTDAHGNPLQGIEVFADNTAYYNMNIFAVTDANGYYRIDLGNITPSSWRVGAYIDLEYNGVDVSHPLHPSDAAVFAGVTGAVRDLTWLMTGATPEGDNYGGLVYVYESFDAETWIEDMDLVEVTFEPLAPLLDGSQGETTVRRLDAGQITDVAVTRYAVRARYLAPAGDPVDLLVSVRHTDDYGPSVEADFGNDGYGYLLM